MTITPATRLRSFLSSQCLILLIMVILISLSSTGCHGNELLRKVATSRGNGNQIPYYYPQHGRILRKVSPPLDQLVNFCSKKHGELVCLAHCTATHGTENVVKVACEIPYPHPDAWRRCYCYILESVNQIVSTEKSGEIINFPKISTQAPEVEETRTITKESETSKKVNRIPNTVISEESKLPQAFELEVRPPHLSKQGPNENAHKVLKEIIDDLEEELNGEKAAGAGEGKPEIPLIEEKEGTKGGEDKEGEAVNKRPEGGEPEKPVNEIEEKPVKLCLITRQKRNSVSGLLESYSNYEKCEDPLPTSVEQAEIERLVKSGSFGGRGVGSSPGSLKLLPLTNSEEEEQPEIKIEELKKPEINLPVEESGIEITKPNGEILEIDTTDLDEESAAAAGKSLPDRTEQEQERERKSETVTAIKEAEKEILDKRTKEIIEKQIEEMKKQPFEISSKNETTAEVAETTTSPSIPTSPASSTEVVPSMPNYSTIKIIVHQSFPTTTSPQSPSPPLPSTSPSPSPPSSPSPSPPSSAELTSPSPPSPSPTSLLAQESSTASQSSTFAPSSSPAPSKVEEGENEEPVTDDEENKEDELDSENKEEVESVKEEEEEEDIEEEPVPLNLGEAKENEEGEQEKEESKLENIRLKKSQEVLEGLKVDPGKAEAGIKSRFSKELISETKIESSSGPSEKLEPSAKSDKESAAEVDESTIAVEEAVKEEIVAPSEPKPKKSSINEVDLIEDISVKLKGGYFIYGPRIVEQEWEESADCEVSDWGKWHQCTRSCGGGRQARLRNVTSLPRGEGKQCPILFQTQTCNPSPCPIRNCEVTAWKTVEDCVGPEAQACLGSRIRLRAIKKVPENGGTPCPPIYDIQLCSNILPHCLSNPSGSIFRTFLRRRRR